MSGLSSEDSTDPWRFVIILNKFVLLFLDAGVAKSFGVLIPEMVTRFNTDFKTMAFICSLPSTAMYFTGPFVGFVVQHVNGRVLAMLGGLLCSISVICVPLIDNVIVLGLSLGVTGFGMALLFLPSMVSINTYFPKTFISMNTITLFESTVGAFVLPVIVERSLEAYGFNGAFLTLGGICLNTVVCGAAMRPRKDFAKPSTPAELNELLSDGENTETPCSTSVDISEDDANTTTSKSSSEVSHGSEWYGFLLRKCASCVGIFVAEPMYTLIIPAIVLDSYALYAWMLFLVPHAEWLGIGLSRAVFLSSIAGISGIFGRVAYLLLLRFHVDNILIFTGSCTICALSLFFSSVNPTHAYQAAMAIVQGFTMFIIDAVPHAMMKITIENDENIPAAIASNLFFVGVGATIGDILSGHTYDVTSSYEIVFFVMGGVLLVVIANIVVFVGVKRCKSKQS